MKKYYYSAARARRKVAIKITPLNREGVIPYRLLKYLFSSSVLIQLRGWPTSSRATKKREYKAACPDEGHLHMQRYLEAASATKEEGFQVIAPFSP